MLLAKLWDKIHAGMRRSIMANTCFLSPREQEMARYLFGDAEGLHFFGGYEDAERKMLVYLPEYLDEDALFADDSPLVCLHAQFYEGDSPSHRDFLGALMGIGISRETVGDICVGKDHCNFFVTSEIAPYLLQNFLSAGRAKLRLSAIPATQASIPEPEVKEIRDTLASLRLDSVISSGFRIGRSLASQYSPVAIITGQYGNNIFYGLPEGDVNATTVAIYYTLNGLFSVLDVSRIPLLTYADYREFIKIINEKEAALGQ